MYWAVGGVALVCYLIHRRFFRKDPLDLGYVSSKTRRRY